MLDALVSLIPLSMMFRPWTMIKFRETNVQSVGIAHRYDHLQLLRALLVSKPAVLLALAVTSPTKMTAAL